MYRFFLIAFLVFINFGGFAQKSFLQKQKQYNRVRTAIKDKDSLIKAKLKFYNIELNKLNILLIAYKSERKLELYAKNETDTEFKKIRSYDICANSGTLGPKRQQGDLQVPEGFYYINRFNPYSSFYLSLGLNYPNASDKKKSNAKDLGGDIFIHGNCVTIGCLPMTDDIIKEIYLYAVYAKNTGQNKIPVYIFPFKMTDKNFKYYHNQYKNNEQLINFWINLKLGYQQFQSEKKILNIHVDSSGKYLYHL